MDDPSLSDEEQGFRNDSCSEDEGHVCSEHTLRRLSGSNCPPEPFDILSLEAVSGGIPVKAASVECGRVSFFSFEKVNLQHLA
eukprot:c28158_g1_i1 orf=231-479(-)